MSRHADPVRAAAAERPGRQGPAPATAKPTRCVGAAAQLATVRRGPAAGLPLRLKATQPAGRSALNVARPSPPAISAVIVPPPAPTRSGAPIQMLINAVMMCDVGVEVYAYSAQTGYSYSFPANHGLAPGTLVQFDLGPDNEPDPATIVVVRPQASAATTSAASSSTSAGTGTVAAATVATPILYGMALLQAEIGGTFRSTVGGTQQSSADLPVNDRIKCHISIIVANPADLHVSFYPADDASYRNKILHVHYRWIPAERRYGAPAVIKAAWKAYLGDYATSD